MTTLIAAISKLNGRGEIVAIEGDLSWEDESATSPLSVIYALGRVGYYTNMWVELDGIEPWTVRDEYFPRFAWNGQELTPLN